MCNIFGLNFPPRLNLDSAFMEIIIEMCNIFRLNSTTRLNSNSASMPLIFTISTYDNVYSTDLRLVTIDYHQHFFDKIDQGVSTAELSVVGKQEVMFL